MGKEVKIYSDDINQKFQKDFGLKIRINSNGGMGGGSHYVYTTDSISDKDLEKKFIKFVDINGVVVRLGTQWISEILEGFVISMSGRNGKYFIESDEIIVFHKYHTDTIKAINKI